MSPKGSERKSPGKKEGLRRAVVTVCSAVGFSNSSRQPDHKCQESPKRGFCQPTADGYSGWGVGTLREVGCVRKEVRPGPSAAEGSGLPSATVMNTPTTEGTVEKKGLISSL